MKFSWWKWKIGLVIAIITGIATGLVGLELGLTYKGMAVLMMVSVGKDMLLYLTTHPVSMIEEPEQKK